jgi:hypothetical protein
MNTNQKKLKLIGHGLKASTLNKLTEGQVDSLFSKLTESKKENKEAVTQTSTTTTYDLNAAQDAKAAQDALTKKGISSTIDPTTKKMTVMSEEDIELDKDNESQGGTTQDPIQKGPSTDDGFENYQDGTDMTEGEEIDEKFESKKQQKYFFAKCGDGKTKEQKKWCKMADEFSKKTNFAKLPEKKKETKEDFNFGDYGKKVVSTVTKLNSDNLKKVNPVITGMGNPTTEIFTESEIEKQIMRLVEKHITPKMSKQDFLNIIEGDTKTAPAKPKVSPGTKPKHPFQPDPDKKGAPKAMKKEVGEGDTKTAPAKPKVSPGTKPSHPFQPDPNKKGAPKAMKKEVDETSLPSFLKFNELGLNKK